MESQQPAKDVEPVTPSQQNGDVKDHWDAAEADQHGEHKFQTHTSRRKKGIPQSIPDKGEVVPTAEKEKQGKWADLDAYVAQRLGDGSGPLAIITDPKTGQFFEVVGITEVPDEEPQTEKKNGMTQSPTVL
jgi:hypothetical protein